MNKKENKQPDVPSRRKFVFRVGALSFVAAVATLIKFPFAAKRNIIECKPGADSKKIKMLTQDGTLVEVDASMLGIKRKKISDGELQHWVNTKKSST